MPRDPMSLLPTHDVINQPEPLGSYDALSTDAPFASGVAREAPAWHWFMRLAIANGWHSVAWEEQGNGGAVAHVAAMYLLTQPEAGFCCPIVMTYASIARCATSPISPPDGSRA